MDVRSKYRLITSIIVISACAMILTLSILSHKRVAAVHLEHISKMVIDQKKEFLKDTVNNVIARLKSLRDSEIDRFDEYTQLRLKRFNQELHRSEDDFANYFINRFVEDASFKMWSALLWNDKTNQIIYSSSDLDTDSTISKDSIDFLIDDIKTNVISYAEIEKGNLRGIFGVNAVYVDDLVKNKATKLIHNQKFTNASYIWVNEIINYDGGDNYAIRRIHPNLPETEGAYLSTSTEDIAGNLPYLEELEGVKKDGELFYTYYFKEMNSDEISEKITYSKLYEEYNWVVAMGIHPDRLKSYTKEAHEALQSIVKMDILYALIYMLLTLIASFTLISLIEKRNLKIMTGRLEEKIHIDPLTEAGNRRYGENILNKLFNQHKSAPKEENPALMMFDIDDFKNINDKYGHLVGDKVLVQIVSKIKSLIRNSDYLIRWGGDEFLGILPGMKENHVVKFCQDLSREIEEMEMSTEEEIIKVTISVGISYFDATDKSWTDGIKRADKALYESKSAGKNHVTY